MPEYDYSLVGYLIPFCKILQSVVFYLLCLFGICTVFVICAMPFFMVFYGFKSISIKFKQNKQQKFSKKFIDNIQKRKEKEYINILEKKSKKKKHD